MKSYKHATHLCFPSLFEKRQFEGVMRKFRRAGTIRVMDLGKDEEGVWIEIAFQEKEHLDHFNNTVIEATKNAGTLKSVK